MLFVYLCMICKPGNQSNRIDFYFVLLLQGDTLKTGPREKIGAFDGLGHNSALFAMLACHVILTHKCSTGHSEIPAPV